MYIRVISKPEKFFDEELAEEIVGCKINLATMGNPDGTPGGGMFAALGSGDRAKVSDGPPKTRDATKSVVDKMLKEDKEKLAEQLAKFIGDPCHEVDVDSILHALQEKYDEEKVDEIRERLIAGHGPTVLISTVPIPASCCEVIEEY